MEFNSFSRYLLASTLSFATMVSLYWSTYGAALIVFIVSFLLATICYVPMVIVGKLTIDAIAKVSYGNAASFALFVVSQYLVGLSEILLIDWLFLGDWAITTSLIHVACIVSFLLGIFSTRKSFYQYKTSLHEQYLV